MAEILRLKPKLAASADNDSEIQHLDIDHQNYLRTEVDKEGSFKSSFKYKN